MSQTGPLAPVWSVGHMAGFMAASAVTACVKYAQGSSVSWQHPTACLFRAAPWDESHLCPDVFSCCSGPVALPIPLSKMPNCLTGYVLSSLHLRPSSSPSPLACHVPPCLPSQSSSRIVLSFSPPLFLSAALPSLMSRWKTPLCVSPCVSFKSARVRRRVVPFNQKPQTAKKCTIN